MAKAPDTILNDILKLGQSTLADKIIEFNRNAGAGDPKIRWNESTGTLQFSNNGTDYSDLGSGSSGFQYIENNEAQFDTSGWAAYADAAGTVPVNGTGGSPNVTITRSTSSPLRGAASFLVTKDAVNRQGEGVSYDFTIDRADFNQVLEISFDYEPGTNWAPSTGLSGSDSDIKVFVYDKDASELIYVNPSVLTTAPSYQGKFRGTFQTSSTSNDYRLILHIPSTNASAWTFKFDNVFVGPPVRTQGTPITDWTSYSPTSSWASGATHAGMYRRVGDTLELAIKTSVTGTPTNASLTFDLPSGLTIDTAKLPVTQYENIVGVASFRDFGANTYTGSVIVADNNTIEVFVSNASSTYETISGLSTTVPYTFANTDSVYTIARVPITGWSSQTEMSSGSDTRVVAFRATKNGNKTIPGTSTMTAIDAWTVDGDTHGFFNATTGVCTVPVSGWYEFTSNSYFQMGATATGQFNILLKKNGTGGTALNYYEALPSVNNQAYSAVVTTQAYLVAGDTITLVGYSSNQNVTYFGSSLSFFTGKRLSGPATIAANERFAPTMQEFTSGSGTYTLPQFPRRPLYVEAIVLGSGGGGGGGGTSASNGSAGNNSTFDTLTANGGGAGGWNSANGATGGSGTVGANWTGFVVTGGSGTAGTSNGATAINCTGGKGGDSYFGGAGSGQLSNGGTTGAGATNTGGGGGGGGTNNTTGAIAGNGGGAGGCVHAKRYNPPDTMSYSVGASVSGGASSANGVSGGNSGSGRIIIWEHYQ
jgi:hypothetical protein